MSPEIRLTPPRRARRRMAGLVIPLGYHSLVTHTMTEGLDDSLDVVTENLPVALGTTFAET